MQKQLKPIHPSAALQIDYQKKLENLIMRMHKSITYWILASYKRNTPEMAQDASPAKEMERLIKSLGNRWEKEFNELSKEMAIHFAKASKDRVDGALKAMLKKSGFSIAFKTTRKINDVLQATIAENVQLISNIPEQYLLGIQGAVMRSVASGRDLHSLSESLQGQFGITKRRAEKISLDQNNKVTSVITKTRQSELGITHAKWRHSGAGKHPRPEHVGFNRKEYDVNEGMYSEVDQQFVWPGSQINCRCVSIGLLPELANLN